MGTERGKTAAGEAGPVRWAAVRRVVGAALDLPPEQRAGFVGPACKGDADLLREVRRLLTSCERAAGDEAFLAEGAAEYAAPVLREAAARTVAAENEIPAALASALADRYLLERVAGRGAMATVYLAHDVRFDRAVAVKVLRPELARACDVRHFKREIARTAKLNHPHIVPVYDSGGDDGPLYYVMPYMEGSTLRHRARGRQLPIAEAVAIARSIGEALDHAHRQALVHRDVKPENILFRAGEPALADFGIARGLDAIPPDTWSSVGIIRGTPEYMSPEQIRAENLDGRSDVYALACVLYEMLGGHPPFTGRTSQAVMRRQVHDEPAALRAVRPGLPPALERAILRALAKDPADRPATARVFTEEIAAD